MNYSVSKLWVTAVIVIMCLQANAQKMITFDSRPISSNKKKSRPDDGKNSLTIGLASVANGYTPVYYERTLTPSFTVQVGAGITYRSIMNDIGMITYNDAQESENFAGGWDVVDDYTVYKYRDARIGQYFSVAPKYYFVQSALNGVYVCPMFELKNYNYIVDLADVSVSAKNYNFYYDDKNIPRSNDKVLEYMRCKDFTVSIGGHYQSSRHVSVGWNVAIGARILSAQRLDVGVRVGQNNEEYFSNGTHSFNAVRPLFAFNFLVGGWF